MADSNYVFEEGEAVPVGNHGETDYVYVSGSPLRNSGAGNVVYESGVGIGEDAVFTTSHITVSGVAGTAYSGATWKYYMDDIKVNETLVDGFEDGNTDEWNQVGGDADAISVSASTAVAHSGAYSGYWEVEMNYTNDAEEYRRPIPEVTNPSKLTMWVYVTQKTPDDSRIDWRGKEGGGPEWNLQDEVTGTMEIRAAGIDQDKSPVSVQVPQDEWVRLGFYDLDWNEATGAWEIYSESSGVVQNGRMEDAGWEPAG